jgi:hypothetical protein
MDVSAQLEPDADGDGFGDESQDMCVGTAGNVAGCPKADLKAKWEAHMRASVHGTGTGTPGPPGNASDTVGSTNEKESRMRRVLTGRAGAATAFLLGLLIATAATAGAAGLITGKQIKDGSISARDLSKAVRTQLGRPGIAGTVGPQGAAGSQGAAGIQGAKGDPGTSGAKGDAGTPGVDGQTGPTGPTYGEAHGAFAEGAYVPDGNVGPSIQVTTPVSGKLYVFGHADGVVSGCSGGGSAAVYLYVDSTRINGTLTFISPTPKNLSFASVTASAVAAGSHTIVPKATCISGTFSAPTLDISGYGAVVLGS